MEMYSYKHHRIIIKNKVSGWILIHWIPSLDRSQISHLCCALIRDLAEIQFSDIITMIHKLTGFCLKVH